MALTVCEASSAWAATVVKVSAKTDHPAATDKVDGSGFVAGEAVDVYWDTTDILLAVADASGKFGTRDFQVPANAAPANIG